MFNALLSLKVFKKEHNHETNDYHPLMLVVHVIDILEDILHNFLPMILIPYHFSNTIIIIKTILTSQTTFDLTLLFTYSRLVHFAKHLMIIVTSCKNFHNYYTVSNVFYYATLQWL